MAVNRKPRAEAALKFASVGPHLPGGLWLKEFV
jgi:hypothetical protein